MNRQDLIHQGKLLGIRLVGEKRFDDANIVTGLAEQLERLIPSVALPIQAKGSGFIRPKQIVIDGTEGQG